MMRVEKTVSCRKKRVVTEPYYPLGMDSVVEDGEGEGKPIRHSGA